MCVYFAVFVYTFVCVRVQVWEEWDWHWLRDMERRRGRVVCGGTMCVCVVDSQWLCFYGVMCVGSVCIMCR